MITIPQIYEALHDDDCLPANEWEPIEHPLVSYVAIWEHEVLRGISIVNAHSRFKWEIHNAILPNVGWKKRVQIGQQFLEWLWASGCKRVIGRVVESNRYAIKYNKFMGMEMVGIERRSFMKGGYLQNEVYFGISAPGII